MKQLSGEVDTRNIGRDVVDQFSIGVDMSSTSGERESLVVDCGDQSRPQQNASTHGTVEIVVQSKRGQNLKEEESERESDTTPKWRGDLSSPVSDVGMLGEPNDGLVEISG